MPTRSVRLKRFIRAIALVGLTAIWPIWPASSVAAADGEAQPTAFTYQAQLKDDGAPVNGAYDFRFTLYTAQTGGGELGSVISEGIKTANGFSRWSLTLAAPPATAKRYG